MAPVLSRSMTSASLASLPSSSFTLKNTHNKVLNLSSTFCPHNKLSRNCPKFSISKKNQRKPSKLSVRCDAAVAEQEAPEASGEKFEYQAEVGNGFSFFFFVVSLIFRSLVFEFCRNFASLLSCWKLLVSYFKKKCGFLLILFGCC